MDSTKIINLSINEKEFGQQISSVLSYMDVFEDKIEKFEKKINSLDVSSSFDDLDKITLGLVDTRDSYNY